MGRARRVSQQPTNPPRGRAGRGGRGERTPRSSGHFRFSCRQRNPEPHGALARTAPRHGVSRKPYLPGQARESRCAVFLRELSPDRIPAAAECRLFHLQRLSAPPGRLRPLPRSPAKSGGGPSAAARRVRHGHHPTHRGRAGRYARLAHRERGARRFGRDDHLRVDGRVVPRRAGNPRLGIRFGHARAQTEKGLCAGQRTVLRQSTAGGTRAPEKISARFGHRLFVQRREDPRRLPGGVGPRGLPRLRDRFCRRRLQGQHAGRGRGMAKKPRRAREVAGFPEYPPKKHGAELRAQRGRRRGDRRDSGLHGQRLHGGHGLALLSRGHADLR